jgi:anaerobic ribonucleoside-triphosphate reductase activating protein
MRYAFTEVVFQEVPDEVSLLFFICGCPLRCPGCHSASLWSAERGEPLTLAIFDQHLNNYDGLVSCICFFGGEWWPRQLADLLARAQERGFRTCLYTGLTAVDASITQHLDYLKTGHWDPRLGGLDQPQTNQRMVRLKTGEVLNSRFHPKGN